MNEDNETFVMTNYPEFKFQDFTSKFRLIITELFTTVRKLLSGDLYSIHQIILFLFLVFVFGILVLSAGNVTRNRADQSYSVDASTQSHVTRYKGHSGNSSHNRQSVTIVTAYFKIKSKHNHSEYDQWISNFLAKIQVTPIIVHTTPDLVPKLKALRRKCPGAGPTVFVEHKNVWSIPWMKRPLVRLNQTNKVSNYRLKNESTGNQSVISSWEDAYREQNKIDPENSYHTPELYAVWSSKSWFLEEAAVENRFQSSFFFWVDIGSFRDQNHPFRKWPSTQVVDKLMTGLDEKLLLSIVIEPSLEMIRDFKETNGPYYPNLVQGGFFGGTGNGVHWWMKEWQRLHDKYYEMNFFVGKEQPLMGAIFLQFPERFLVVRAFIIQGACGDQWFYFQDVLAEKNETHPGCQKFPLLSYF